MRIFGKVCVFSLCLKAVGASLDKVEHVDEVGVVDVPALDAHDVRKHVEVGARTHAAVEDDPETWNVFQTKDNFFKWFQVVQMVQIIKNGQMDKWLSPLYWACIENLEVAQSRAQPQQRERAERKKEIMRRKHKSISSDPENVKRITSEHRIRISKGRN